MYCASRYVLISKYFLLHYLIRYILCCRSSESSFVNMTAGAAEDVCDSFISKEKKINLC